MKIKRDPADTAFSYYVRLRDGECVRCRERGNYSPVRLNDKGLPISHDASHYFGRGRESTRFDPENVDTLCKMSCHKIWGSEDKEEYRDFKIKQLDEQGFKALTLRANLLKKKDRALDLIIAKALLNEQQSRLLNSQEAG